MIQGTTLDAELAECGDVLSIPGMSEMLTTYVILSRVRRADALLLLRAFSPYLFRLGSPPGPECLIELLRHRFSAAPKPQATTSSSAQETASTWSTNDAMEKYKKLAADWEAGNKMLTCKGMEWRCFDCNLSFPAEMYHAC